MNTAVLSGEAGSVSWKLSFQYDGLSGCRVKCNRNGKDSPELLYMLLIAFADVLKKRIPPDETPFENLCAGEGLTGELSLSTKDDEEPTYSDLCRVQSAIRAGFSEYMETHPDEATLITENAIQAERILVAVRRALSYNKQCDETTFDLPDLPKHIRWMSSTPDSQQMHLDLSTLFNAETSRRSVLAACKRLRKNVEQVYDTTVLQHFNSDFRWGQELLAEMLRIHDWGRRFHVKNVTISLEFLPSRYANWKLKVVLLMSKFPSNTSQVDALFAKISEIPGMKRCGNNPWRDNFKRFDRPVVASVWQSNPLGSINDLATFRKVAWPAYVKVFNQLRAICLDIFQS